MARKLGRQWGKPVRVRRCPATVVFAPTKIGARESQDTRLCETPNTFVRKGVGAMAEAAFTSDLPP